MIVREALRASAGTCGRVGQIKRALREGKRQQRCRHRGGRWANGEGEPMEGHVFKGPVRCVCVCVRLVFASETYKGISISMGAAILNARCSLYCRVIHTWWTSKCAITLKVLGVLIEYFKCSGIKAIFSLFNEENAKIAFFCFVFFLLFIKII